jgi:hypothetical protein
LIQCDLCFPASETQRRQPPGICRTPSWPNRISLGQRSCWRIRVRRVRRSSFGHRPLSVESRDTAPLGIGLPPARTLQPSQQHCIGCSDAANICVNGIVCVSWQQVSGGVHRAGARCNVHVNGELLRLWIGDEIVKTPPEPVAAPRVSGSAEVDPSTINRRSTLSNSD